MDILDRELSPKEVISDSDSDLMSHISKYIVMHEFDDDVDECSDDDDGDDDDDDGGGGGGGDDDDDDDC